MERGVAPLAAKPVSRGMYREWGTPVFLADGVELAETRFSPQLTRGGQDDLPSNPDIHNGQPRQ